MRISDWSSDVCSSDLHLLRRGARAVLPGHRSGEVAAVGGKTNVVRFAQPCPKMTHHVEQHFVTIADQQRFHLVSSAARAAMSAPGGTSSAAAQPIRSGSYDSRNPKVAASMSGDRKSTRLNSS